MLCVVVRSVYRTVELSEGWVGYLITHESYFIGLDGVMMVVAVGVFHFVQPRWAEGGQGGRGHKSAMSDEEAAETVVRKEET